MFVGVWVVNFFVARFNKNNLPKGALTPELLYLKKVYHVNLNKINKSKFSYIIIFINTFIISTIYIILMYLLENWIIRIIVGVVLLILMIIICYGLLGRYYSRKEVE